MRVGGLSGELGIKDGDRATRKNKVQKLLTTILVIGNAQTKMRYLKK